MNDSNDKRKSILDINEKDAAVISDPLTNVKVDEDEIIKNKKDEEIQERTEINRIKFFFSNLLTVNETNKKDDNNDIYDIEDKNQQNNLVKSTKNSISKNLKAKHSFNRLKEIQ